MKITISDEAIEKLRLEHEEKLKNRKNRKNFSFSDLPKLGDSKPISCKYCKSIPKIYSNGRKFLIECDNCKNKYGTSVEGFNKFLTVTEWNINQFPNRGMSPCVIRKKHD